MKYLTVLDYILFVIFMIGGIWGAIKGFMDETGYRFGRFDFIRKDGELWFLELNPNGQWAWLDEKNEHGLVSMVADAIKAEDLAHRENPFRR